jgi:hypothetical protein
MIITIIRSQIQILKLWFMNSNSSLGRRGKAKLAFPKSSLGEAAAHQNPPMISLHTKFR